MWDASTVASLDAIATKHERRGKTVEIIGQNQASADRHAKLTGQLPHTGTDDVAPALVTSRNDQPVTGTERKQP